MTPQTINIGLKLRLFAPSTDAEVIQSGPFVSKYCNTNIVDICITRYEISVNTIQNVFILIPFLIKVVNIIHIVGLGNIPQVIQKCKSKSCLSRQSGGRSGLS